VCHTQDKSQTTCTHTRTGGIVGAVTFQLGDESLELACECKLGEFLRLSLLGLLFDLVVFVLLLISILRFGLVVLVFVQKDSPSGTSDSQWIQLLRQR
jgi:hypothetical protein